MKTTVIARNSQIDNLTARLNNGYFRFYAGTKPATADAALSGNTLLAELRFAATAFAPASGASATSNAIAQDASADADGTATFVRCFASDGTTAVCDLTVGTSGAEVTVPNTTFVSGLTVTNSAMVITLADGA
jgi:hypothetical protein